MTYDILNLPLKAFEPKKNIPHHDDRVSISISSLQEYLRIGGNVTLPYGSHATLREIYHPDPVPLTLNKHNFPKSQI